jgi:hypothetical protein
MIILINHSSLIPTIVIRKRNVRGTLSLLLASVKLHEKTWAQLASSALNYYRFGHTFTICVPIIYINCIHSINIFT